MGESGDDLYFEVVTDSVGDCRTELFFCSWVCDVEGRTVPAVTPRTVGVAENAPGTAAFNWGVWEHAMDGCD